VELLAEAERLRDVGRPADNIRRSILTLNQNLPAPLRLPPFSAGGLMECVNTIFAGVPGGAA
jgi:hypothetical protein